MPFKQGEMIQLMKKAEKRENILSRFPKETQKIWEEYTSLSRPIYYQSAFEIKVWAILLVIVTFFKKKKKMTLEEAKSSYLKSRDESNAKFENYKTRREIIEIKQAFAANNVAWN
jgi:hypothetical protein